MPTTRGFLYKRKGGRYLPQDSLKEGTFYWHCACPEGPGGVLRVSLRTKDRLEAFRRAGALGATLPGAWQISLAEAIGMLLRSLGQNRWERAAEMDGARISLADLWMLFTRRVEIAPTSLNCYRQAFRNFRAWSGVEYSDELDTALAERYTRHLFAKKVAAKSELNILKRIWKTVFPSGHCPWDTGLRLTAKERCSTARYRRLEVEEVRAFLRAVRREEHLRALPDRNGIAKRRRGDADRRHVLGAAFYADLHDASFFAWNYGMRTGSLAALRWEDFIPRQADGYFLHVPPKTRGRKPWPLEIPFMPETTDILLRRMSELSGPPGGWLFPSFSEAYRHNRGRITTAVRRCMEQAGVKNDHRGKATMHSFRASFITRMDEAGAPSAVTDSITGHGPRTVHDLYSHACVSAKRRWLVRAIPPLTERQ